jgi:tRNA 2-thiouridine synthesizing protein A
MSDTSPPDQTLDTSGLVCPIPILMAKKKLTAMAPGNTLEIFATDPAAANDFEAFCRATGNALVASGVRGETSWFLIRRSA